MGRILAIDYGLKRTGVAVTDPLQIIATALETVPTHRLMDFLENYFKTENVEKIVVGEPKTLSNDSSSIHPHVEGFVKRISIKFPDLEIHRIDERFSTQIAQQTMILGGTKKKDRQEKGNLDKISATILLQDFMQKMTIQINNNNSNK